MGEVIPFMKPEDRKSVERQLEYWEGVHHYNSIAFERSGRTVEDLKRRLGKLGIENGLEG